MIFSVLEETMQHQVCNAGYSPKVVLAGNLDASSQIHEISWLLEQLQQSKVGPTVPCQKLNLRVLPSVLVDLSGQTSSIAA